MSPYCSETKCLPIVQASNGAQSGTSGKFFRSFCSTRKCRSAVHAKVVCSVDGSRRARRVWSEGRERASQFVGGPAHDEALSSGNRRDISLGSRRGVIDAARAHIGPWKGAAEEGDQPPFGKHDAAAGVLCHGSNEPRQPQFLADAVSGGQIREGFGR